MINKSCKNGLIKFHAKGKGSINRKQNRNLMALMWCIGVKYGYIIVQEKKPEIPLKLTHNVKKIREEICYKAWRDFKVPISFKQINCLLYLKGDRMPFTAIIILMTIYNLLKENGGIDKNVKNALRKYLAETNPFRYCGEYYDKETDEIYLRARYYRPAVGRFLMRDTYIGESDDPLSLHLYTYCENDGVNAWDPSGNISFKGIWNKVKQVTKKVVNTGAKVVKKGVRYAANKWRYSTLGKYFARATESGKYSKFMNTFDFFQDSKGVYHTSQNCWQKLGGYNDLYDFFFDAATEMKAIKFNLPTNTRRYNLNKTYILWAWKGDYFNLGAGGELGIYSNYINIHSLAETRNPIYSKLQVFYKGKRIIKYHPSYLCWWITGFNPKIQYIKTANDLSLKCKADFSNVSKDLRKAFFKKAKKSYGKYWKVNKKRKTATFKW